MRVEARPGWLSPEGHHHPCKYTEHTETACAVFAALYPAEREALLATVGWCSGEAELVERGWVRVGDDGAVTDHNWDRLSADELTQAQLDALFEMLLVAEDGAFRDGLLASLGLEVQA